MSISENNKWISVDERLPEEGVDVLVWMMELWPGYDIGCVTDGLWVSGGVRDVPVTHWQYLPSPPDPPEVES